MLPNTTITLNKQIKTPLHLPVVKTQGLYENITSSVIKGNINHKENNFNDFDAERLIPKMLSTEGPKLAIGDVNGDGLEDFFIAAPRMILQNYSFSNLMAILFKAINMLLP